MSHRVLAKIDKLNALYAEQRSTLNKLNEYVERELLKNRQRQRELNMQRRKLVAQCRLLGSGKAGRVKVIMNSTVPGSPIH